MLLGLDLVFGVWGVTGFSGGLLHDKLRGHTSYGNAGNTQGLQRILGQVDQAQWKCPDVHRWRSRSFSVQGLNHLLE